MDNDQKSNTKSTTRTESPEPTRRTEEEQKNFLKKELYYKRQDMRLKYIIPGNGPDPRVIPEPRRLKF